MTPPQVPEQNSVPLPDFLRPLNETLLIQCHNTQALKAAQLADRDNGGLVITPNLRLGSPEVERSKSVHAARHLREKAGFTRPILLDASRYSGKNRLLASEDFNPTWIKRQRELQLPVLTDSGYVGENDIAGINSILTRAADLGDATALLPLHASWLRSTATVDALITSIKDQGVPVALIFEYKDDPFELKGAVASLLRILNAGPPVLLLRCDVSALGALCLGAVAAAVGTTTGLRHLYPQGPGGPRPSPRVAAIIKECMSYFSLDKILWAYQNNPDDGPWICHFPACVEIPITLLGAHSDSEKQESLAFTHSMQMLLDLRDDLLKPGSSIAQRAQSWRGHCENAQFRHMEIEAATDWGSPPGFLGRWLGALADLSLQQRVR